MIWPLLLVLLCSLGGCFCSEIPGDSVKCQDSITVDQVLDKLASDRNIDLSDGVKLVKVNASNEEERGRSVNESIFSRIKRFLTEYELQVKLSDVFRRKQDMIDVLRKSIESLNALQEDPKESFRGHGGGGFGGGSKKGGNAVLMMATMMGGTMAALGFGALAMLVMKALTVSSMALLLSAVLGLRRLLRRPDDDAGFNRISYIPVHAEHRKRRSLQELPYRAYVNHKRL